MKSLRSLPTFLPQLITLLLLIPVASLLVLRVRVAGASDWPMYQHDPGLSGFNVDESWARPPLELKWSKWLRASGPPTAVGETVYVGDEAGLHALVSETGALRWRFPAAVAGTPAVVDGVVFFSTRLGTVFAVGAYDGQERWRFDPGAQVAGTSPVVARGTLYFATIDGRLYALDSRTGRLNWFSVLGYPVQPPVVAGGMVLVLSDRIHALDAASGIPRWVYGVKTWTRRHLAFAAGLVYLKEDADLTVIDAASGSVVGSYRTPSARPGGVSLDGNRILLGAVTAYDARTGARIWSFDSQNSEKTTRVAIANGRVFVGSSHDAQTAFSTSDGRLYVLDAATGALLWQYADGVQNNDWFTCDPSPVVANGWVYVQLSMKRLFAFKTTAPEPLPPSPPEPQLTAIIQSLEVDRSSFDPLDADTGRVVVTFDLGRHAKVDLDVLDENAKVVKVLVRSVEREPGRYSVVWPGLVDAPEIVDPRLALTMADRGLLIASNGIYQVRLKASDSGSSRQDERDTQVLVSAD